MWIAVVRLKPKRKVHIYIIQLLGSKRARRIRTQIFFTKTSLFIFTLKTKLYYKKFEIHIWFRCYFFFQTAADSDPTIKIINGDSETSERDNSVKIAWSFLVSESKNMLKNLQYVLINVVSFSNKFVNLKKNWNILV